MLFHHLFSVCGILKVLGENRKPICRHLHNYHLIRYALIMDLPMHHWLSWVIKGQNLPEISVQLPAFSSLFFTVGTTHHFQYIALPDSENNWVFPFPNHSETLWSVWSSVLECLSCSRCQMLCVALSTGSKAKEIQSLKVCELQMRLYLSERADDWSSVFFFNIPSSFQIAGTLQA